MQTLKVSGMTCGGCVSSVKNALAAVAGGTPIKVDLQTGQVEIADSVDKARAIAAIEDAGYDVAH